MKKNFLFILPIVIAMISCTKPIPADLASTSLIPLPVEIKATGSSFEINNSTIIYIDEKSEELLKTGQVLIENIQLTTGIQLTLKPIKTLPKNGIALVIKNSDASKSNEGYQMNVTEKSIRITANNPAGTFMGSQTLLQSITQVGTENKTWIVATGTINDYPQYAYRGAMLDVSRHFFGINTVKRFIDQMAIFKLNKLHLHLSDDQGWRIEIKSWPKLTTVGGSSQVGGEDGGFYTQEEYKEIIRYAKERFITVIPEIDMPGHTNAAYVAYPELNGTNKKAEPYIGTGVGFSTLATRNEKTYAFIDDVIKELASITEGEYLHIGGDESHVTKKDDYVYFINRVRKIVKKYNKKMIGWDEVAHADIEEGDVVQYWSKGENALLGKQKSAKILMSPAKVAYLDMQYDSTTHIGLHWMGYIEVYKAYNWDPATLEEGISKEDILGVESPLWTETVVTEDDIDYLIFPRLIGHAEIGWTPAEKRNWDEYKVRLADKEGLLNTLGIKFYKSSLIPWKQSNTVKN